MVGGSKEEQFQPGFRSTTVICRAMLDQFRNQPFGASSQDQTDRGGMLGGRVDEGRGVGPFGFEGKDVIHKPPPGPSAP